MIIVAKAIQNEDNPGIDWVEAQMPQFRMVQNENSMFAYARTFNPRGWAVGEMRDTIQKNGYIWLYLIGGPWYSPLRLKIVQFVHSTGPLPCSSNWLRYVPRLSPEESYVNG